MFYFSFILIFYVISFLAQIPEYYSKYNWINLDLIELANNEIVYLLKSYPFIAIASYLSIFLLYIGWEYLYSIFNSLSRMKIIQILKIIIAFLKASFILSLKVIMIVIMVSIVVFILYKLSINILNQVLSIIPFVPIMLLPIFALKDIVLWFRKVLIERKESQKLQSYGLPTIVTSQYVYRNCLSYKTSLVRKRYLESLRLNRIPLRGEIEDPPRHLLEDKLVAEELARLREQWYGLSS